MIKRCIQLAFILVLSVSTQAQNLDEVIMTVGGSDVTVGEFKYIYEKNNGNKADYSPNSVKEYLELYKKFKLKVAKARELQLDTIPSLRDELKGYKRQLANSYLMDKEIINFLVDQLYERKQTDVSLSHIYFAFPSKKKKNKIKVNDAEERANKAYEMLKAGTSWSTVLKGSDDKSSSLNDGNIGYYTAMMPSGYYDFENAMYTVPVGSYSKPIKTPNGFHILRVNERRPAYGQVQVAQILVKSKDNPDAEERINSAYQKLEEGEQWRRVVTQFSQDMKTKNKKGILPVFGINSYEKSFEDAAFAIAKEGEYSKPFKSRIGWHILKLIKKVPSVEARDRFDKIYTAKIKKDARYEYARKNMIRDIKVAANYQQDDKLYNTWIKSLPKDFLNYKWKVDNSDPMLKQTLFSFGGDKVSTLGDFALFCKKNTKSRLRYNQSANPVQAVADKLLSEYIEEKAIEYEQKNLEAKYEDFRSLMREYEEGILLFEATKMAVWDKANKDTVGLQKFYEKNNNRYMTEPKAVLATVTFIKGDKKTLNKALKMAYKKPLAKVAKKYNKKQEILKISEETLAKSDQKFAGLEWKEGATSSMSVDTYSKNPFFKKITKILPSRNKTLKEARGYVVSDYQESLEKQWITELAKQFKIVVNQDVVQKLIK